MPNGEGIIGLGTNCIATATMVKTGSNFGATGENVICYMVGVDMIVGSISILAANSMFGELSVKMAEAISNSIAPKYLLPINNSGIQVVGAGNEPLPYQIEKMVTEIEKGLKEISRGER